MEFVNITLMKYILCWAMIGAIDSSYSCQPKLSKKQFIKDSLEIIKPILIRPQLRAANRVSFHLGQKLTLNGFDAGVLLKDKLRLALGYYFSNGNINAYKTSYEGIAVERLLGLNYGSINTEYIFLRKRFLSLGLPLDFGFGRNKINYLDIVSGENFGAESGPMFLTDFGFSGIFKPIRWVGLRGVVGYRKFIISRVKNFNFDGGFYSIGLSVDIREIIKDLRMCRLKNKYKKGDRISNAVDLITD